MGREISRRLVHASGSLIPAAYLLDILSWNQVRLVLAMGIVLALAIEASRLLAGIEPPFINRMIRSYEEEYLAGYALYVLAGGGVGLVFEPNIAIPAILMLTIGDPISGLLSTGELRRVKRPHVLLVMFVVCLALGWWFLDPLAAVAAAFVATIADGVKPVIKGYVIDDNLTIPIGAAVSAYLVMAYGPTIL